MTTIKKLYIPLAIIAAISLALALTACSKKNADTEPVEADNSPTTSTAAKPADSTDTTDPTEREPNEYPSWEEIGGDVKPYIPPLEATPYPEYTTPEPTGPITEPGEVKPVPEKPTDADVAATMPASTPTATAAPTTTPKPTTVPQPTATPKPTATADPEPVPVPTAVVTPTPKVTLPEPYVDENGVYYTGKITHIRADGTPVINVIWQNDEGIWCGGWVSDNGELYEDMHYPKGTTPPAMPGAPWADSNSDIEKSKAKERRDINAELSRLTDVEGYSREDALKKMYESGYFTRKLNDYNIEYISAINGLQENSMWTAYYGYNSDGHPNSDKNGSSLEGYLDNDGYFIEGFFYEGGMPWYDENGNYKGYYEAKRIQHGEEGMHWERDASGKMVGTYKGIVIPVPYVKITPEEFKAMYW
jgi:hypothetical protein